MLVSDLKLLLRFNTTSLFEEVSQTTLFKTGSSSIVVMPEGGGYTMQNDQYLFGDGIASAGYNLDISNSMTMGFWLYSVNPGLAINPNNSSPTSIEMPLLDFVDTGSAVSSIIRLTEHTAVTGNNYLKVTIDGYSASTEQYTPLVWHHFWIVYSADSLRLYVDGVENVLQEETGSYSASIPGSFLNLYVNHSLDGYAWNVAKNYGIIDDIFVFNIVNLNVSDIQRVINDGVEFLVDDVYTDSYIDKSAIYFNDPGTITITSLIDDMSYIFIGRNDGKILRGSPLLWETRRTFSNLDEINTFSNLNNNDIANLRAESSGTGFLRLFDQIVRL